MTMSILVQFDRTVFLCSLAVGIRKLNISVSTFYSENRRVVDKTDFHPQVTYNIACEVHDDWDPVDCSCQNVCDLTVIVLSLSLSLTSHDNHMTPCSITNLGTRMFPGKDGDCPDCETIRLHLQTDEHEIQVD